jgi:MFS transporter, AAHS family, 3-hydroxyphenylpropionic acid transporter
VVSRANADRTSSDGKSWLIVALCLFVAIVEGIDIQSVGVAASGIARTYNLGSTGLGLVMSTSIFGLMIGAAVGGWASDYMGRKPVLIAAMLVLGSFTLATIVAPDVRYLVAARFLAGIGLGGAFPTLIALISETVPERYRGIGMGAMYCGLPIGGAFAALTMAGRSPSDWAAVFHLGGWGPLLLAPVLAVALPAQRPTSGTTDIRRDDRTADGIFGSRAASTLLLWISFFFTLLVVYTLLNWLPSLLLASGIERAEALHLSMTMNLGAAVGGLATGLAVDAWRIGRVVGLAYIGMVASLAALVASSGVALYAAACAVGFFVIGGQLVLYAIAPRLYPALIRGRGVGAAVSIGRAGSITGPALAGVMLGSGMSPNAVPIVLAGGLVIALIAASALVRTQALTMPGNRDSAAVN